MAEYTQSLEQQIFDWEEWDSCGSEGQQFMQCTVKTAFGPYTVGDYLEVIFMNYENATLEVYSNDGALLSSHKLYISVAQSS